MSKKELHPAEKQIRLNKTGQTAEILNALKRRYAAMTDAEILKMALSRFYVQEMQLIEHELDVIMAHDSDPNDQTAKQVREIKKKRMLGLSDRASRKTLGKARSITSDAMEAATTLDANTKFTSDSNTV